MTLAVTVSGGQGGHSGMGIALGRSNAVKVLGRALREALGDGAVPARLALRRQEPQRDPARRESRSAPSRRDREQAFRAAVAAAGETIRDAFAKTDPGVTVVRRSGSDSRRGPWTEASTATLLDAVALVPTGPLALSPDFDDLVETSTSLGEAITEGDRLTLHSLSRSSNDSALPEVIATLDAVARLAGGTLEVKRNYGGWRPDLDSPALAAAKTAYERVFGEPPIVTAVHAGLETAVIGTKVPGLDMLSFGPQIEFPHSPDERVSIPTVERFWKLLVARARRAVSHGSEVGRTCADRSPGSSPLGGVVVVIVVAALIGGRDDSGETVPAGEWAQNVCGAVGVWRGQIEAIVEDITMPPATGTGSEEPQSETPEGRTGLIRVGLERSVQATETVVEAIEGSGVPDTENGEEVGRAGLELGERSRRRPQPGRGLAR